MRLVPPFISPVILSGLTGSQRWRSGFPLVPQCFLWEQRVPVVGPFALTMTADDGVQAVHAFSGATIVPIHFEGWKHLSESREVISPAFEAAGVSGRVRWMEGGTVVDVGG
jgi:hypothetical protein